MRYNSELTLIKFHDTPKPCFCQVTWQIKNFASPLAPAKVHTKYGILVTYHKELPPINLYNPLKTLYLLYRNGYGHQACQGGDMPQRAPAHKFPWPLSEVVLWGHLRNQMHYISIYRRPMNNKLGKVQTYRERLLPLKPHDPLIT